VPGVQFGLSGSLEYAKASGATSGITAIALLAGPTFNFPFTDDISDAFFLFGGAGFTYASTGSASATEFTFGFAIGKRFEIVDHVCYRPNFGMVKVSGVDPTFNVTPLAFSFVF